MVIETTTIFCSTGSRSGCTSERRGHSEGAGGEPKSLRRAGQNCLGNSRSDRCESRQKSRSVIRYDCSWGRRNVKYDSICVCEIDRENDSMYVRHNI